MCLRLSNDEKIKLSQELWRQMNLWESQPGNKVTVLPFGETSGIIDEAIQKRLSGDKNGQVF